MATPLRPMKLRMNKAAADLLTARTVAAFKRVGDVAEKIGRAAESVTPADASATARPLRNASAAAFASLLDRLFRW
jgi:hypothetical protein